MYELFILAELCEEPMHGYLLHDILAEVLAPLRTVSWGTLYPILRDLEADGLIMQAKDTSITGHRKRKVYTITSRGRLRIQTLMEKPLDHTGDTEDIFRIKLANFHLVDLRCRRQILLQYKVFLELMLDHVRSGCARIEMSPSIENSHRENILQAMDYTACDYRARLAWVDKKLQERGESS